MKGSLVSFRPRRVDEDKQRQVIELYRERRLSQREVARQLTVSEWSVRNTLVRNNVPRRSISEACMKYPKTNFSGEPAEKARMLGFLEDCSAGYCYRQMGVATSTTYFFQIYLFCDVFGRYGHIDRYPTYNRRRRLYQWYLRVYLNPPFDFLPQYKTNPTRFLVEIADTEHVYIYITSLIDTEGAVCVNANHGHPLVVLSTSNNNRQLLEWAQITIGGTYTLTKTAID